MKILAVFIKLASSSIIVYLSLSEKLIHNYAVHMIVTFPWCALINNHTLIISSLSKCRLLNQIIHTCVNVSIILQLKDNMNLIWGFLSPSQAGTLWNFSPSLDPDSSSYDPGCVLQVSTHLLLYLKKKKLKCTTLSVLMIKQFHTHVYHGKNSKSSTCSHVYKSFIIEKKFN